MKRKLTGSTSIAITLFVTSGMLASVLGVRQIDRMSTVQAIVVSQNITAGQQITPATLRMAKVDADALRGTLQDPNQLVGKLLTVTKKAGETIYADEVTSPKQVALSKVVPEGKVLFTLKQPQSGIPFSKLNHGDRFDILVKGRGTVRTVARNVRLIGIVRQDNAMTTKQTKTSQLTNTGSVPHSSLSMVMAVDPKDVYPLASIGSNDVVSIVLHSAYDVANGTQPLLGKVATHRDVAIHSGGSFKTVRIKR